MKGDFSRDSFDPAKHFARVLLQQGRVLTDADFNEQAAIQRELLRAFVVDLVGRRWRVGEGFAIGGATADDFTIGAGRCWLGELPWQPTSVAGLSDRLLEMPMILRQLFDPSSALVVEGHPDFHAIP